MFKKKFGLIVLIPSQFVPASERVNPSSGYEYTTSRISPTSITAYTLTKELDVQLVTDALMRCQSHSRSLLYRWSGASSVIVRLKDLCVRRKKFSTCRTRTRKTRVLKRSRTGEGSLQNTRFRVRKF